MAPSCCRTSYLIEQMANFNRERIPERQPHAKGGGAFGIFTVTTGLSRYTKAAVFAPGTETEVVVRFSTVAGERGSPVVQAASRTCPAASRTCPAASSSQGPAPVSVRDVRRYVSDFWTRSGRRPRSTPREGLGVLLLRRHVSPLPDITNEQASVL